MQQNAVAESETFSSAPRFFIDTNIFLELEFQDSRWHECRQFLKKVETGEITSSTSDFVIYSSILEIESKAHGKSETKIETFVNVLSSLRGLSILRPSTVEMADAGKSMRRRKLDYDDSYVVSSMMANGIKTLVSFDRHFDNQSEIKRLEPIRILEGMESKKF